MSEGVFITREMLEDSAVPVYDILDEAMGEWGIAVFPLDEKPWGKWTFKKVETSANDS